MKEAPRVSNEHLPVQGVRQPDALEADGQMGTVRHSSNRFYCTARGQTAVVSVVERTEAKDAIHFVLWCSLRAAGKCDEQCLRTVETAQS